MSCSFEKGWNCKCKKCKCPSRLVWFVCQRPHVDDEQLREMLSDGLYPPRRDLQCNIWAGTTEWYRVSGTLCHTVPPSGPSDAQSSLWVCFACYFWLPWEQMVKEEIERKRLHCFEFIEFGPGTWHWSIRVVMRQACAVGHCALGPARAWRQEQWSSCGSSWHLPNWMTTHSIAQQELIDHDWSPWHDSVTHDLVRTVESSLVRSQDLWVRGLDGQWCLCCFIRAFGDGKLAVELWAIECYGQLLWKHIEVARVEAHSKKWEECSWEMLRELCLEHGSICHALW